MPSDCLCLPWRKRIPQQIGHEWGKLSPGNTYAAGALQAINVDGKLDDNVWQSAPWTDDFVDIEGDVKPAPRFRTRAKMLWDDQYFYIAALLEEPDVWGTLTKHDSVIFHDNDFEVFIDPNGDNHEYYEFEMNALNTGWDLFLPRPYKNGGKADNGWEIPRAEDGRLRGRHSERSGRPGQALVRGNRHSLEGTS